MKKWRDSRKENRSKKKRKAHDFVDFALEVLFWVPELIILPFRIVFWLIRGLGRLIADSF